MPTLQTLESEVPTGGPKAVTLDVWYTLLYLSPKDRTALERRRWRAWADPMVAAGFSRSSADRAVQRMFAWGDRSEARGHTPPVWQQAQWLRNRLHRRVLFDGLPSRLDAALAQAPVRLAVGAITALRSLSRAGVRLGVVSNVRFESGAAARAVLESTGIRGNVDAIELSCDGPWSKPRPEPFRRCLRALHVSPSAAVHIGDLAYDVRGARGAGLEPVLYTGLHRWESPRPAFRPGERPVRSFSRWIDAPALLGVERRILSRPPRRLRESVPAARSRQRMSRPHLRGETRPPGDLS